MTKLSKVVKIFIYFFILSGSFVVISPFSLAENHEGKYPTNFRLSEDISRSSRWRKPRYWYQMSLRWDGVPGARGYEIEMYSANWISGPNIYGKFHEQGPRLRTHKYTGTVISFATLLTGEKDREYDYEELRQEEWWRNIARATYSQRMRVRGRSLFGWNRSCPCPSSPASDWSTWSYNDYEEEKEKGNYGQPKDEKVSIGGDPINLTNGNLFSTTPEFSVSTRGLPLEFSRTYNSRSDYNGPLGYGWTHSFDLSLEEDSYNPEGSGWYYLFLRRGDGCSLYFQRLIDGSYVGPRGDFSALVEEADGSYLLQGKHGDVSHFSSEGKIVSMSDRQGNETTFTYDTQGKLTEVIGPGARRISFSYNGSGKITRVTDPAGRIYNYAYDGEDNLVQSADPLGQITFYFYNENHNLINITYPDGTHTYFSYDDNDRATATWNDGGNQKVILAYDEANKTTRVTDALGRTTTYIYNYDHQITEIVDPEGGETKYIYDGVNLTCTSATNALGNTSQFSYDGKGNLLSSTDPLGNTTVYTYESDYNFCTSVTASLGATTNFIYDAAGNLIEITDSLGNGSNFSYDAYGELIFFTNSKNSTTQYSYDDYGNLLQVTDALGNTQEMNYDILGNCLSTKDRLGNVSYYTYDLLNRLSQYSFPDGNTINYTYDSVGNCTAITNQLGETYQYQYDAVDRLTELTDSLGNVTTFTYDLVGNRTEITDAKENTTDFLYDNLDRLIKETTPLGNETAHLYDILGNVVSMIQADENAINYVYDANSRLREITYPDGKIISYLYDANGRCTEISSSDGEVNSFAYDALGRVLQVDRGAGGDSVSYAYDSLGHRLAMIDQNGGQTLYLYDVLSRLLQLTNPEGEVAQYNYDAEGNVIELSYANGTRVNYTYDNLNQLIKLENLSAAGEILSSFQYEYDAAGRKIKEIGSDNTVITYAYDTTGRLTQERKCENKDGEERELYCRIFTLDALGNALEKVSHRGELKEQKVAYWALLKQKGKNLAFRYMGLRKSLLRKEPVLLAYRGSRFRRYRRIRRINPFRILRNYRRIIRKYSIRLYRYWRRPWRLSRRWGRVWRRAPRPYSYRRYFWRRWSYRPNPKPKKKRYRTEYVWEITKTKTTYIYDVENRLLSYEERNLDTDEITTSVDYSYDANGNRVEKIKELYSQGEAGEGKTTETWSYQYDYEHRLKGVLKDGEAVATYLYDSLGKRIEANESGEVNKFYYDGLLAILERNSDGEIIAAYTRGLDLGGGIGGIISTKNLHPGSASFFHYDGRGNVIKLSDEAGQSQASYRYDAYGNEVSHTGGEDNAYRFSTKEYSSSTGLIYFGARYYDPEVGRFITRDPLGFAGGINQYLYCEADPVNFRDPYGLLTVIIHGLMRHDEGYSRRLGNMLRSKGETVIEYKWPGNPVTHDILVKNLASQMQNYEQLAKSSGENFNVIGHSWGSVAGYEAIVQSGANVDNFITMGSPLTKVPKSSNVKFWKNYWSSSLYDAISWPSIFTGADEFYDYKGGHFGYWDDYNVIKGICSLINANEEGVIRKKK